MEESLSTAQAHLFSVSVSAPPHTHTPPIPTPPSFHETHAQASNAPFPHRAIDTTRARHVCSLVFYESLSFSLRHAPNAQKNQAMNLNNVATELARGPQNKLGPSVPPPACEVSARIRRRARAQLSERAAAVSALTVRATNARRLVPPPHRRSHRTQNTTQPNSRAACSRAAPL